VNEYGVVSISTHEKTHAHTSEIAAHS